MGKRATQYQSSTNSVQASLLRRHNSEGLTLAEAKSRVDAAIKVALGDAAMRQAGGTLIFITGRGKGILMKGIAAHLSQRQRQMKKEPSRRTAALATVQIRKTHRIVCRISKK